MTGAKSEKPPLRTEHCKRNQKQSSFANLTQLRLNCCRQSNEHHSEQSKSTIYELQRWKWAIQKLLERKKPKLN